MANVCPLLCKHRPHPSPYTRLPGPRFLKRTIKPPPSSGYRKYRSLGTPPRLTSPARLLHNPRGYQRRKGRFSKDLVDSFLQTYRSVFTSSWWWSNRAWKVSLAGVPRLRYLRCRPPGNSSVDLGDNKQARPKIFLLPRELFHTKNRGGGGITPVDLPPGPRTRSRRCSRPPCRCPAAPVRTQSKA